MFSDFCIDVYQLTAICKDRIREDGKCTFCCDEKEDLTHLFLKRPKKQNFWDNFPLRLQSCQIVQPGNYVDMTTVLVLTQDSFSFKLHIVFCCLIAKNFIWICRLKECYPNDNNSYFIWDMYQLEKKTPSNIYVYIYIYIYIHPFSKRFSYREIYR